MDADDRTPLLYFSFKLRKQMLMNQKIVTHQEAIHEAQKLWKLMSDEQKSPYVNIYMYLKSGIVPIGEKVERLPTPLRPIIDNSQIESTNGPNLVKKIDINKIIPNDTNDKIEPTQRKTNLKKCESIILKKALRRLHSVMNNNPPSCSQLAKIPRLDQHVPEIVEISSDDDTNNNQERNAPVLAQPMAGASYKCLKDLRQDFGPQLLSQNKAQPRLYTIRVRNMKQLLKPSVYEALYGAGKKYKNTTTQFT